MNASSSNDEPELESLRGIPRPLTPPMDLTKGNVSTYQEARALARWEGEGGSVSSLTNTSPTRAR